VTQKGRKNRELKTEHQMKGVIIYEAAKEPHVRRNNSRFQMSIRAAGAAAAGAPPSPPRTSWEK